MSFLSAGAIAAGVPEMLSLDNLIGCVAGTRTVTKADMRLNDYQPKIEVDSRTYEVRADGELLTCEPAIDLPLAQRYFLF
jgi:urease subunit alpha